MNATTLLVSQLESFGRANKRFLFEPRLSYPELYVLGGSEARFRLSAIGWREHVYQSAWQQMGRLTANWPLKLRCQCHRQNHRVPLQPTKWLATGCNRPMAVGYDLFGPRIWFSGHRETLASSGQPLCYNCREN